MSKVLAARQRWRGRFSVCRLLHRPRHIPTTVHSSGWAIWPSLLDQAPGLVPIPRQNCSQQAQVCLPHTMITTASCQTLCSMLPSLQNAGKMRDNAGGAGGREVPADHHPPSQHYTTSVGLAVEYPASKVWTEIGFHLLHKIHKGPTLTVPEGRGERMKRNRAQAQIKSRQVMVSGWNLRGCDTKKDP